MATDLRDVRALDYRFDPRSRDALWLARQLLEQWLLGRHVRSDRVPDLLVAASEACTDAVLHRAGPVVAVLRGRIEGSDVLIDVEDGGPGVAAGAAGEAGDVALERGGDLRLAAALVDELHLWVAGGAARVRLVARAVVLDTSGGGRR